MELLQPVYFFCFLWKLKVATEMAKSASATAKALDRLANSSDRANQRADKLCRCEAYDVQEAVLSTDV